MAVEAYEGDQNVLASQQNFQEGNYWTGAFHAGLAMLNAAGVKGGLRQLKNDVHLAAFPNAHCFPAGTPIATELGLRPIESIECNDRVWSFDLMTGKWELCRVAETYERDHDGPLVKLFIAGSAIESTYHHPYWVVEGENLADRPEPDHVRAATVRDAVVPGRWVDAGDLCIGDVLLLQDGRREPITEILLRQATCRVYNLAVEGLRNYAVGPVSVLAHNMCAAAAKNVPNPDGKLGSPAHRARVGEVVSDIESRKLIAHTEFRVKTVNGQKATRFIDVVAIDPNTMRVVEVHQVGRTLKSNPLVPVARERAAFRDVRQSLELRDAVRIFHDFI